MSKKKITIKGTLKAYCDYDEHSIEIITTKGTAYINDQKFDLENYLMELNGKRIRITIEVIK